MAAGCALLLLDAPVDAVPALPLTEAVPAALPGELGLSGNAPGLAGLQAASSSTCVHSRMAMDSMEW